MEEVVPEEEQQPARCVFSTDFAETTFIAITAYQNKAIKELKIAQSPYAKALRQDAPER